MNKPTSILFACGLLGSVFGAGVSYADGQNVSVLQSKAENKSQQRRLLHLSALDLSASKKKVLQIIQGEQVELVIEGVIEAIYHLHGYDLTAKSEVDQHAVIKLVASNTGRYPLVQHMIDPLLGNFEVTVAYLEIRSQ